MSTNSSLIGWIRSDVGDDATTPKYTDANINTYIDKAVNVILRSRLGTDDFNYTSASGVLDPDPSGVTHKECAVKELVVFTVEDIIYKREYRDSTRKGIKIQDGDTSVDTSAAIGGYKDLIYGKDGSIIKLERAIRSFVLCSGDGSGGGASAYY
jgi:hypothetical protein